MNTPAPLDNRLQTEIEALRPQYPDTQDLYREVCLVLFFRHGITPTANKLYQLVRKGSMSAPAEALNRFWETLREKSRIRIEHPDLPPSLQSAAGEMMGAFGVIGPTRMNYDNVSSVLNYIRNELNLHISNLLMK